MSSLAQSIFKAAGQYDRSQTRVELEFGTVIKADPPNDIVVRLRKNGEDSQITVSTKKGTLLLTEACIWKSITLGHTHGGSVPPDLNLGTPPADRYMIASGVEAMPKYQGVIHSPYVPFTIQDGLAVGDRVVLLRGLDGYKYVCLSRIIEKL